MGRTERHAQFAHFNNGLILLRSMRSNLQTYKSARTVGPDGYLTDRCLSRSAGRQRAVLIPQNCLRTLSQAGLATAAAGAGVSEHDIARTTGHRSVAVYGDTYARHRVSEECCLVGGSVDDHELPVPIEDWQEDFDEWFPKGAVVIRMSMILTR